MLIGMVLNGVFKGLRIISTNWPYDSKNTHHNVSCCSESIELQGNLTKSIIGAKLIIGMLLTFLYVIYFPDAVLI